MLCTGEKVEFGKLKKTFSFISELIFMPIYVINVINSIYGTVGSPHDTLYTHSHLQT